MDRRSLLLSAGAAALSTAPRVSLASPISNRRESRFARIRPGDSAWPNAAQWAALNVQTGGALIKVDFPLARCAGDAASCDTLFKQIRNPYFIGDTVGLTQTLGWVDAWTSSPSVYAVAAKTSGDVAAAVNFAREHKLRLVVKGGGHSYLGGSNAPDSLMIWTRAMNAVELHDAFTPQGCAGHVAPEPAVNIGAGAMWMQAYDAVTTKGSRYVQGGGCTTVGVAGLVQGGGFGSHSKGFGTGAANLLEAEIVTADGVVRVVNARQHPDLFWALKGGGGGTFGVVTRLTLCTHKLPAFFGAAQTRITAKTDDAYRRLVEQVVAHYAANLFNPHWGEQIRFTGNTVSINMVFQGLTQAEAQAAWRPFFDGLTAAGSDYTFTKPFIFALPAARFWDAAFMKALPGVVKADDRPDAPKDTFYWSGDAGQVGQVLHGYQSAWLPRALLDPARQPELVDALLAAAKTWGVSLHFNKGMAGGDPTAVDRSRDTSTNPAVIDAFALAISAGEEPPAYPGIPGHEPHVEEARKAARSINEAMAGLKRLQPAPAAYISESDYFQADWRAAYWGPNYSKLATVKQRYDPDGLFFVHHGVGSEGWSADGFTKL